jgi:hypothetical protein
MPICFLSVFFYGTTLCFIYSQMFILVTLSRDLQSSSYLGVTLYCIVIKVVSWDTPEWTKIACINFGKQS